MARYTDIGSAPHRSRTFQGYSRARKYQLALMGLTGVILMSAGRSEAANGTAQCAKVVDTQTAIPDLPGRFFTYDPELAGTGLSIPALSGRVVAFTWEDASKRGPGGVYTATGRSLGVVDSWPMRQEGCGSCNRRGSIPSVSSGNLAFLWRQGEGMSGGYGGDSNLRARLGQGSPVKAIDAARYFCLRNPGGVDLCQGAILGEPSVSETRLAYNRWDYDVPGNSGIYSLCGSLPCAVVTAADTIPGGIARFSEFGTVAASGTTVVFVAQDSAGRQGVYTRAGGRLTTVADTHTEVPGGGKHFTAFGGATRAPTATGDLGPSIHGGSIAFLGFDSSGGQGIYRSAGGVLATVADTGTAIPGGVGSFSGFGNVSVHGGSVVFAGEGSGGQQGIYVRKPGTASAIQKLIATNERLDGKAITKLELGNEALSHGMLALRAGFPGGQGGIYKCRIP